MKNFKGENIMKKISIAFLAAILLLSGCSEQDLPNEIPERSSDNSSIADPMKEPADKSDKSDGSGTGDAEDERYISTSYMVSFGEDNVSLTENGLIVSPNIKGGGAGTRIGIMLFIDGVIQKYRADDSTEENYMSVYKIERGLEVTPELNVSARLDGGLDEHSITMITMLAPDYVPPTDSPYFGNYHRTLSAEAVILPDNIEEVFPAENYKVLKAENSVFSQKQIEKYGIEERTQSFVLRQSDKGIEDYYTLNDGESKLTLRFAAYTKLHLVEDHRVTFYVNHKPVTFNGGYEYLDYTLEGEKITELDIELDDVKPGDFVYFISAPLVPNGYDYANKSVSKLIVSENDVSRDEPAEGSDSQTSPPQSSSSEDPSTPSESTAVYGESSVKFVGNIRPKFSVDGNVYAVISDGVAVLSKLDDKGNVLKKIDYGFNHNAHGDKISIITDTYDPQKANLVLLDKELNEIKSVEVTFDSNSHSYDFDDKTIAFIYMNEDLSQEIRVCDWELKNTKTLMEVPSGTIINKIALANDFVAFILTDKSGNYYGICNFDGHNEMYLKSNMANGIGVYGNTALWSNQHGEDTSKGEITLYKDGKFEIIRPTDPFESQDVFLTGENEFFTWQARTDVVRQYKDGVMTAEIPLEKGEHIYSIVRAGNKIFAGTKVEGEYQLKIWELS